MILQKILRQLLINSGVLFLFASALNGQNQRGLAYYNTFIVDTVNKSNYDGFDSSGMEADSVRNWKKYYFVLGLTKSGKGPEEFYMRLFNSVDFNYKYTVRLHITKVNNKQYVGKDGFRKSGKKGDIKDPRKLIFVIDRSQPQPRLLIYINTADKSNFIMGGDIYKKSNPLAGIDDRVTR